MKTKRKIAVVIGTRPNFIKVTQFRKAAALYPSLELVIVHTGQHYDDKMAAVFFEQFNLVPDIFLNVKQGSAEEQIKEIKLKLSEWIEKETPDLMLVVGDVNSTRAAAEAAHDKGIRLAHVESGLRSFDDTMPEEHNRIITDGLSEIFFVTEASGRQNLLNEGKPEKSIHFVGNTMMDTMVAFEKEIEAATVLTDLDLLPEKFVLMTMHRPATVDSKEGLFKLSKLIEEVSEEYKIVFPVHPRTIQKMREFGIEQKFMENKNVILSDPMDYFAFQKLVRCCAFILTDSGGIQEESTFLRIPCLTLRANTERPVTITEGTNELLPFDLDVIRDKISKIQNGSFKKGSIPMLWDGKASERIFKVISELL